MNFVALRAMVEGLVKQHVCPSCNAHIPVSNVDIVGAAGSTINLDLQCQECGNHSMIKSEIMSVKLTDTQIQSLSQSLNTGVKKTSSISDAHIVELDKKLKQNKNITDLFNDLNK